MSVVTRVKERIASARERRPLLDHAVRTVEHYGEVKGNIQAGAVTYFAFISFFPLLALGFAVIGYVARVYPDAKADLVAAINSLLPGLVGGKEGQVSLASIEDSAPGILSVGILVVLYSGLGWLSSMRDALTLVFDLPPWVHPNFLIGKLRDLMALASLGLILVVSVGVSGVVRGGSQQILEWLGLAGNLGWLLGILALLLGMAANALLFFALFKILVEPSLPSRALWSGAVLGAVGFEVLKQVSQLLLASTRNAPAFQAFGIALIIVVWIYYFSQVVMYAASWAYVHPAARALRPTGAAPVQGPPSPPLDVIQVASPGGLRWAAPFAAGAGAMLAAVAVLKKRK
ncbi:MAG TPA: YhjD/YihY/BrkB family envelope integrity protein [Nocardioides sp.]|nr:YhjD/YihY/BrkB family envelope integrity protein [Nocardioides sp.]